MSKRKKNRKTPPLNGKGHKKALVLSDQIITQTPAIVAAYSQFHKGDNYSPNGIDSGGDHQTVTEASEAPEIIHLGKDNSTSAQNSKKRRSPREQKHPISLMQRFNADYYVKAIIETTPGNPGLQSREEGRSLAILVSV